MLEKSFKERLDKLDECTTEIGVKEPFDASKFWSIEKQNSHTCDSFWRVDYKIEDRDAAQP